MTENGAEQGIRQLEQALAEDPASGRFVELAELLVDAQRYREAARVCENGLGYHPSESDGHLLYGKALVGLGQVEEAIRAFERACALRTADCGVHCEAGRFLAEHGYHDLALPYLQNGLRMDPDDPRVRSLQVFLSEELGIDIERAETGRWQRDDIFSEDDADFSQPTAQMEAPGMADDGVGDSLDDDDDDDEPPTLYTTNPLALQARAAEAQAGSEETGDEASGDARLEQETRFDPEAGLRAEVSHAVDQVSGRKADEPPTRFDPPAPERAPAAAGRPEPPTMFTPDEPAPWDGASSPDIPAADAIDPLPAGGPKNDPTRVSNSRPRGPAFSPLPPGPPPATSISYFKVFLVVVPFLLAAVAGGLYFGFQHLRNEKISTLMEQADAAEALDTFAGYSEARATLLKLLTLQEDNQVAKASLAFVSARIHDEFGPNLALREEAARLLSEVEPGDETRIHLLWTRFHLLADDRSKTDALAAEVDQALANSPQDPQLLALHAELALKRGDGEAGFQGLKEALAAAPSDPRALVRLARLEVQRGEAKQATSHLVRALAINGIHVRALLSLAGLRIRSGEELDQAAADLEKVLRLPQVIDRHRAQAYLASARLAFREGQRSRALASIKAGSELMQDDVAFQRRQAKLCLRYFELDEAAAHAKKILELRPDDMDARLLHISTDLPRGQADRALRELNALVGKKVPAAPFLRLRGEALYALGQVGAALSDLGSVPEDAPQKAEAWAYEVLCWLGQEDVERAKRQVQLLLRKYPDEPMAHYAMGRYRLAKRLRRGAAASFRKVQQLDPRGYLAPFELARMDFEAGQYDEAEKGLRLALAANPFHVASWELLGRTKLALGEPQAALDAFMHQVKERPHSPAGLVGMAEALLDLGQVEKALAAVRKGRKAGADDAHARHVEGRVYMANGKLHSAVRALKAADALDERNPEILADLGLALLGIRSLSRAEDAFEESLKRSRRWQRLPRAQEGLGAVLAAKRKYADAAKAFERAAGYAKRMKKPETEIARLYMRAGRTMLRDSKSKDKRYGRARRLFRLAARAMPTDPEPLFEVAAAYDREDKTRSARSSYLKVLEVAPAHAETLYRLGLLEFDEGKDDRAKELLSKFIELQPKNKLARRAKKILARIK